METLRNKITCAICNETPCGSEPVATCEACKEHLLAADDVLKVLGLSSAQLAALDDGGTLGVIDKDKPKVVCLCGSTKFKQEFIKANFDFTMKGYIVLTVGWFSHADGQTYFPTPDEKKALDELHKRKIDLADYVFVLNVGGYIGDSTRSEIAYAEAHGKPISYLEPVRKVVPQ